MIKKKEEKVKIEYTPIIHYENESVDVCRFCCNALTKNNFYYNDIIRNLELLENILFNYSILKVLSWNKTSKINKIEEIFLIASLDDINEIIKNIINDPKKEKEYFAQYIYTILYIYEIMNNNKEIKWIKSNEVDNIIIKENENNIIEIITPNNIEVYKLPSKIVNTIKNHYEKAPIIHK